MPTDTYLLNLFLIALGLTLPLAGVIFSDGLRHWFFRLFASLGEMEFPVVEDHLGYFNEWNPSMGIDRMDFLVLQRDDAFRAGIDPLNPEYPPLLDQHLTSDGKPLKKF